MKTFKFLFGTKLGWAVTLVSILLIWVFVHNSTGIPQVVENIRSRWNSKAPKQPALASKLAAASMTPPLPTVPTGRLVTNIVTEMVSTYPVWHEVKWPPGKCSVFEVHSVQSGIHWKSRVNRNDALQFDSQGDDLLFTNEITTYEVCLYGNNQVNDSPLSWTLIYYKRN